MQLRLLKDTDNITLWKSMRKQAGDEKANWVMILFLVQSASGADEFALLANGVATVANEGVMIKERVLTELKREVGGGAQEKEVIQYKRGV